MLVLICWKWARNIGDFALGCGQRSFLLDLVSLESEVYCSSPFTRQFYLCGNYVNFFQLLFVKDLKFLSGQMVKTTLDYDSSCQYLKFDSQTYIVMKIGFDILVIDNQILSICKWVEF